METYVNSERLKPCISIIFVSLRRLSPQSRHGLRHHVPRAAGAPRAVAKSLQIVVEKTRRRAGAAGRAQCIEESFGGSADQVEVCRRVYFCGFVCCLVWMPIETIMIN